MNVIDILEIIKANRNSVKLLPDYVFRGQSDESWTLIPSLTRLCKYMELSNKESLQLEQEIVDKFSVSAQSVVDLSKIFKLNLSSKNYTVDSFGWFTLMQHFGAPTRCLDWTRSPLVALYFACSDFSKDGAIYIANYEKTDNIKKEKIGDRNIFNLFFIDKPEDILVFARALNTNERIEA